MMETLLHAGTEHPDLLWVLIPSLLAFFAGLGIGTFSDRVRNWIQTHTEPSAE